MLIPFVIPRREIDTYWSYQKTFNSVCAYVCPCPCARAIVHYVCTLSQGEFFGMTRRRNRMTLLAFLKRTLVHFFMNEETLRGETTTLRMISHTKSGTFPKMSFLFRAA